MILKAKINKLGLKIIIGLFLALCFIINVNDNNYFSHKEIVVKSSVQYTESFIHVNGNWSAMTSYEWCSGDGSWDNPYKIENVTIDASGSLVGSGILIENSLNNYFKVQNCTIFNVAPNDNYGGIKMNNVANGTLFNNNCSNNGRSGIMLLYLNIFIY